MAGGYTYTGAAANGIYGVKLRDGNYEVLCETEPETHER